MRPEELRRWKDLEVRARRSDAPHPDDCPKLKIRGVAWAIPPRRARLVPVFESGTVRLREDAAGLDCPEADALMEAVDRCMRVEKCPRCGQPIGATAELDPDGEGGRALELAVAAAASALRRQYDLADADLAELLVIEGDGVPEWFYQLVRWAHGLSTSPAPDWASELPPVDAAEQEAPAYGPDAQSEVRP